MSNQAIQLWNQLPAALPALKDTGTLFAQSGLWGCQNAAQGFVVATESAARGVSPCTLLATYDIVEGKLRKKSLAVLAEFRQRGGKHRWLKSGDEPAPTPQQRYAELWVKDKDGEELTYRYSMADAQSEGLIKPKSRWEKRPGNMLRARCISNGLGMLMPELVAGGCEADEDDSDAPPAAELKLVPESQPQAPAPTPTPAPAKVIDIRAELVPQQQPTATAESVNALRQKCWEIREKLKAAHPTATTAELDTMVDAVLQKPAALADLCKPDPAVTRTMPLEDTATLAKQGLAPAQPEPAKAPTPAPAPQPQAAPSAPAGEGLSNEMTAQLENAIGTNDADAALRWFVANGHLKKGQSFQAVKPVLAKSILASYEADATETNRFRRAIQPFKQ